MDERVFAGKYRTVRELGIVAAGRTYLATDPDGRKVVVKVVRPADEYAADVVEGDIAAASGIRHPALPRVYEWGHDGVDFFVVREYMRGADLKSEIEQQGRLAPLVAARYGSEAADALAQIHRRGLVHGNVKTANLVRMPEDPSGAAAVKLVGYGLGLRGDVATANTNAPPATAYYLAPEQVTGAALTPQTDVYGLGAVLYELVTGRVPFDGATASAVAEQHTHSVPRPVREVAPDVPASLERVIMRALEKSPAARYGSAKEMRIALDQVASSVAPIAARTSQKKGISPWVWVALAAVLVLLGLGVAWALGAFSGAKVGVPDVVGRPVAVATATIEAAGLTVGAITYTGGPVKGVADGSVTTQTPKPTEKVATGSQVDIVLAGVEKVAVPAVVGQQQTDAAAAIQGAGLTVGKVTQIAAEAAEPGVVLAQSPVPGTLVARGAAVALTVAKAPPVAGTVPDVGGQTQAQATDVLTAAGFTVKVVVRASADVPAGNVIDQDPVAGVQAVTGSTVTINVSSGPEPVTVPDVTTKTQADATNTLTDAGFKVKVTEATGVPVGTVTGQSPSGGTKAQPGSTVVITVAK